MPSRSREIIVDEPAIASSAVSPALFYWTDILLILFVAVRLLLRIIAVGVAVAAVGRSSGHCKANGSLSLIKLGFMFFLLLRLPNIRNLSGPLKLQHLASNEIRIVPLVQRAYVNPRLLSVRIRIPLSLCSLVFHRLAI